MLIAAAFFAGAIFFLAFKRAGIHKVSLDSVNEVRRATHVMKDASLDDDKKERLVRRSAIYLLKAFVKLTFLALCVLALPVLFLSGLAFFNFVSFAEAGNFLLNWKGLLAASLGAALMSRACQ